MKKQSQYKVWDVIQVHDSMQSDYSYTLSVPVGKNFAEDFLPELTPRQMLEKGVFEGKYLNDCQDEFPQEWFVSARTSKVADVSKNCFGIKSRQPLSTWREKWWILPWDPDVRGWFQWYCRYYLGRREPWLDTRQIKRWKAFKRHKWQILKNCEPHDMSCRPRQRQALLQWAYNPFI